MITQTRTVRTDEPSVCDGFAGGSSAASGRGLPLMHVREYHGCQDARLPQRDGTGSVQVLGSVLRPRDGFRFVD